ncbi:MAG: hypothetical protein IKS41_05275 [Alphaproteobacteria bacterium]|nr:hypothetical protein [Alphaproteobacteria bacterium]
MTNWYSIKEQCAGRYRLLFLWWVYRLFRLKGLKIILYPIVFFIVLFSKNGRQASQKYREVLYSYQTNHNIKSIQFSSYRHIFSYAFSLAEKMSAVCDPKSPLKFEVYKDENYKSFQKDLSTGVFLISSHLGNIEALSAFPRQLSQHCPMVNALMQINQNSIFHQFIQERANNTYFHLYPAEQFGFQEIMSLYEKISTGEAILMAGDRISSQSFKDILSSCLLDRNCVLPKGVFRFAKKINHPTYAILLLRTSGDTYKLILKQLDISRQEQDLVQDYTAFLEKYLLEYPDQWYNFFDFFK